MTSLAVPLRKSIEDWAERLQRTSPLAILAKKGELPPRAFAFYLESLRFLFQQSERNLAWALARSEQLGNPALIEYFRRKSREERGHDRWAMSDLAQLPRGITQALQPAHAVVSLAGLQRTLISRHPVCFATYILWTEYFTVLIGDDWLDSLSACGYERTGVSAIAKHVEADREHAAAGFGEFDELWQGDPEPSVILAVVEEAGRVFEAFCEEVCGEARRVA